MNKVLKFAALAAVVLSLTLGAQARAAEVVINDFTIQGNCPGGFRRIDSSTMMSNLNQAAAQRRADVQGVRQIGNGCRDGYTLTGTAGVYTQGSDTGTVTFRLSGTLTALDGCVTTVSGFGQAPWSGGANGAVQAADTAIIAAVNQMTDQVICQVRNSDRQDYRPAYRSNNDCRPARGVAIPTGIHVGGGSSRVDLAIVVPARSYRYERRGRDCQDYGRRDNYRRHRR